MRPGRPLPWITFDDGQGTHRFAATDYVEIIPDSWLAKMRRGLRADLGMVRFGGAVFLPDPFGGKPGDAGLRCGDVASKGHVFADVNVKPAQKASLTTASANRPSNSAPR